MPAERSSTAGHTAGRDLRSASCNARETARTLQRAPALYGRRPSQGRRGRWRRDSETQERRSGRVGRICGRRHSARRRRRAVRRRRCERPAPARNPSGCTGTWRRSSRNRLPRRTGPTPRSPARRRRQRRGPAGSSGEPWQSADRSGRGGRRNREFGFGRAVRRNWQSVRGSADRAAGRARVSGRRRCRRRSRVCDRGRRCGDPYACRFPGEGRAACPSGRRVRRHG